MELAAFVAGRSGHANDQSSSMAYEALFVL